MSEQVDTTALRISASASEADGHTDTAAMTRAAADELDAARTRIAALTALVAALDDRYVATITADAARAAVAVAALGGGGDVTLTARVMRDHVERREVARTAVDAARRAVEALP